MKSLQVSGSSSHVKRQSHPLNDLLQQKVRIKFFAPILFSDQSETGNSIMPKHWMGNRSGGRHTSTCRTSECASSRHHCTKPLGLQHTVGTANKKSFSKLCPDPACPYQRFQKERQHWNRPQSASWAQWARQTTQTRGPRTLSHLSCRLAPCAGSAPLGASPPARLWAAVGLTALLVPPPRQGSATHQRAFIQSHGERGNGVKGQKTDPNTSTITHKPP